MYYPDDLVEEVRSRNDIVDVISGYVKLQKKGGSYFGLCPFHNEKTPSFSVSPSKQMYYCFGCGAGGNVITFLMEYENYTFSEALKVLADRVGIELPEEDDSRQARAQADLKAELLEINKLAANYFYHQLKSPNGKAGYDYLKNRGLSDTTITHFGLGFANKTSDDLYRYLKSKGYSDDILNQTGLVTVEEKGAHDKFWNRVMFPIMDVNNRVIGFGGRVLGDALPKYLNSPETRLFDKSRSIYGLNFARTSRKKQYLLCEGYMDVIALHQAGFTNAVASLGTALTPQHANVLKRYTDQVILTYDSDEAGVKAALRAIPILKEAGISCKVIDMKPYNDPDEFIKNKGPEEFSNRIDKAGNSFMFEIEVLKGDYNMDDPEQKTFFYNAVAKKLLEFPEAVERDNYIQAVSREYSINYEDLRSLVAKQSTGMTPESSKSSYSPRKKKQDKDAGVKQSQALLLTWLIEDPDLFAKIDGIITPEDFSDDLYHETAELVFKGYEEGELNPARIISHFIDDDDSYKQVTALFNADLKESLNEDERKKAFSDIVINVKKNSLDEARRNASDFEQLQKIIKAQSGLDDLRRSLDQ